MTPFALALSNVLQFAARHWKWLALGAAVIAVVIGIKIVEAQRDEARQQFEIAQAQRNEAITRLRTTTSSLNRLEADVTEQNKAIDNLAVEGQARIEAGQAELLAEVRRGAKATTVARELTQSPSRSEDQSRTSAKVLGNKDLL